MTGIKDIDNIIFNYKYQLEHAEKFNKSLDLINDSIYTNYEGIQSSMVINNKYTFYINKGMYIIGFSGCSIENKQMFCIHKNKYYDNYKKKNMIINENNMMILQINEN